MEIKLPKDALEKAVRDLISFNEFTFYSERGTDECTGLTFALEFLFCSFNLNSGHDDSAELIEAFVMRLDMTAQELGLNGWENVRANLPFSRCLNDGSNV